MSLNDNPNLKLEAEVTVKFNEDEMTKALQTIVKSAFSDVGSIISEGTSGSYTQTKTEEPIPAHKRKASGRKKEVDGEFDTGQEPASQGAESLTQQMMSGLTEATGITELAKGSGTAVQEMVSGAAGKFLPALTYAGLALMVVDGVEKMYSQYLETRSRGIELQRITGEADLSNAGMYQGAAIGATFSSRLGLDETAKLQTSLASKFRDKQLAELTGVGAYMMDQWGLSQEDVTDRLDRAVNRFGMSTDDVIKSLAQLSGTAIQTGGSLQDMSNLQKASMQNLVGMGVGPKKADISGQYISTLFGKGFSGTAAETMAPDLLGKDLGELAGVLGTDPNELITRMQKDPRAGAESIRDFYKRLGSMYGNTDKNTQRMIAKKYGWDNFNQMVNAGNQKVPDKLPPPRPEGPGSWFDRGENFWEAASAMGEPYGKAGAVLGPLAHAAAWITKPNEQAKTYSEGWKSLTRGFGNEPGEVTTPSGNSVEIRLQGDAAKLFYTYSEQGKKLNDQQKGK